MKRLQFVWHQTLVCVGIVVCLTILAACGQTGHGYCQVHINGICYDKPKASNPPITASWQIIDADTRKPIPGVLISFQVAIPIPGSPGQARGNPLLFARSTDGVWRITGM